MKHSLGSEPDLKSACCQPLLVSSQQLSGCNQQVRVCYSAHLLAIYVVCYNTIEIIQLTTYKLKLVNVLLHARTIVRESRLDRHKYVLRFL